MSNVIILNDSTMFQGTVNVSTFIIKTSFGDLKFDISQIWYIDYRSTHYNGNDALFTSNGSDFNGEVLPEIIPIDINGQTIDFPKSDINFLMLSGSRTGAVSDETKAKLRQIGTAID